MKPTCSIIISYLIKEITDTGTWWLDVTNKMEIKRLYFHCKLFVYYVSANRIYFSHSAANPWHYNNVISPFLY